MLSTAPSILAADMYDAVATDIEEVCDVVTKELVCEVVIKELVELLLTNPKFSIWAEEEIVPSIEPDKNPNWVICADDEIVPAGVGSPPNPKTAADSDVKYPEALICVEEDIILSPVEDR